MVASRQRESMTLVSFAPLTAKRGSSAYRRGRILLRKGDFPSEIRHSAKKSAPSKPVAAGSSPAGRAKLAGSTLAVLLESRASRPVSARGRNQSPTSTITQLASSRRRARSRSAQAAEERVFQKDRGSVCCARVRVDGQCPSVRPTIHDRTLNTARILQTVIPHAVLRWALPSTRAAPEAMTPRAPSQEIWLRRSAAFGDH
jgi:hypothetical protein